MSGIVGVILPIAIDVPLIGRNERKRNLGQVPSANTSVFDIEMITPLLLIALACLTLQVI